MIIMNGAVQLRFATRSCDVTMVAACARKFNHTCYFIYYSFYNFPTFLIIFVS